MAIISLQCFANGHLEDQAPFNGLAEGVELRFKTPPNIEQIMAQLQLDEEDIQFALYQGKYIEAEDWQTFRLKQSAELRFWPRISGG